MEKLDRIFHIADIHCRLYQRHGEYKEVFDRLFSTIKKIGTENSLIIVAGDIVHSKTEMSPELIDLVSYFFRGLSDLCRTIVIPGNHDFNAGNLDRLDALSPIVDALGIPNLYYWKNSGIISIGDNLELHHYSIMDDNDVWDKLRENITEDCKKIAIYHGVVQGAITDTGFFEFNNSIPLSYFSDNYDITILGDIHKMQYLDDKKTVAYCGSLIQQNFGEGLEHGMLVWDVNTGESEFVKIENRYGYVTLDIDSNGDIQVPSIIPEYASVRIKTHSDKQFVKDIIAGIKSKYPNIKIATVKSKSNTLVEDTQVDVDVLELKSKDVQLEYILKYLELSSVDIGVDDLKRIHTEVYSNIDIEKVPMVSSVNWKPIKFEFSNMFSYGDDNVIDFTQLDGVIGIFAPNAHGKSALLDSLVYCIFDKSTRTHLASKILNTNKDSFWCKFTFSIDGVEYVIERNGNRSKSGNVRVDVKFYKINGNELVDLSGKRRDETNKIIRTYLGEYDDFVLTIMRSQYDNRSFVGMTQKERQELLYRFLGLSVFSELYDVAHASVLELKPVLKYINIYELTSKKMDIESRISEAKSELDELINKKSQLKTKIDEYESKLEGLKSKIQPIPDYESPDILKQKIKEHSDYIDRLESNLEKLEIELADVIKNIDSVKIDFDEEDFNNRMNACVGKLGELKALEDKRNRIQFELKSCHQSRVNLKSYEYNPDCEYCIRNEFVVSAMKDIEKIPILESELNDINLKILEYDGYKKDYDELLDLKSKFYTIKEQLVEYTLKQKDIEGKINQEKMSISYQKEVLDELKNQLENSIKYKTAHLANLEIEKEIENLSNELGKVRVEYNSCKDESVIELIISSLEDDLSEVQDKIDEYHTLNNKYEQYLKYEKLVGRNGVPAMILKTMVNRIENIVNESIHDLVDFTFNLMVGEDDTIDGYISYSHGSQQIELASGMEQFIIDTAIRSALLKLSNSVKSNFLIMDEGFGVLDSDKLHSIGLLFDYIRKNFDFALCVSHVKDLRDFVDVSLSIEKNSGYSRFNLV
jgi:DNA repair exonuclease SbcCD ATPase subunit